MDEVDTIVGAGSSHTPYRAYRPSGVDWLGHVPKHWNVDRLKWTATGCKNGVWGDEPDDSADDIACIRVADFDRVGFKVRLGEPTMRSIPNKDRRGRLLERGDLLLEKSGGGEKQPVGAVMMFDHETDAVTSNFVARMPIAAGFDSRFVVYLHAKLYQSQINTRSIKQTTGIQNLDAQAYLDERVPLPPLDEQEAIAAFLDERTRRIDELIEAKRKLLDLLAEKRQAVITHAVTRGLDPNAELKPSGIKWLGDVPRHWDVVQLRHVSPKLTVGIVVEPSKYYVDEGVPCLRSLNVKMGKLTTEDLVFISPESNEVLAKSKIWNGDLVAVRSGQPGATGIVDQRFHGANCIDLIIIRSPKLTTSKYLCHFLNSEVAKSQFAQGTEGAIQGHFNVSTASGLRVVVPPIDEQATIVSYIEGTIARLDDAHRIVAKAITGLSELRTALISAAITGKIKVDSRSHTSQEGGSA